MLRPAHRLSRLSRLSRNQILEIEQHRPCSGLEASDLFRPAMPVTLVSRHVCKSQTNIPKLSETILENSKNPGMFSAHYIHCLTNANSHFNSFISSPHDGTVQPWIWLPSRNGLLKCSSDAGKNGKIMQKDLMQSALSDSGHEQWGPLLAAGTVGLRSYVRIYARSICSETFPIWKRPQQASQRRVVGASTCKSLKQQT